MGMGRPSIALPRWATRPLAVTWLENNFTRNRSSRRSMCALKTSKQQQRLLHQVFRRFVQNLMYGFSGLRIHRKGLVGAYAPCPPDGKSMTLKKGFVRGQHYDITIDRDAASSKRTPRRVDRKRG